MSKKTSNKNHKEKANLILFDIQARLFGLKVLLLCKDEFFKQKFSKYFPGLISPILNKNKLRAICDLNLKLYALLEIYRFTELYKKYKRSVPLLSPMKEKVKLLNRLGIKSFRDSYIAHIQNKENEALFQSQIDKFLTDLGYQSSDNILIEIDVILKLAISITECLESNENNQD